MRWKSTISNRNMISHKYIIPWVVCSIMNIFDPTSIDNFFPCNWRAFYPSHDKTEFSHGTMILCTSIKTHSRILNTNETHFSRVWQKFLAHRLPFTVYMRDWGKKENIRDLIKSIGKINLNWRLKWKANLNDYIWDISMTKTRNI